MQAYGVFEDPFWTGVFERCEDGRLSAARVVFGSEPKDYEILTSLFSDISEISVQSGSNGRSEGNETESGSGCSVRRKNRCWRPESGPDRSRRSSFSMSRTKLRDGSETASAARKKRTEIRAPQIRRSGKEKHRGH